jgi:hypothetical protein
MKQPNCVLMKIKSPSKPTDRYECSKRTVPRIDCYGMYIVLRRRVKCDVKLAAATQELNVDL